MSDITSLYRQFNASGELLYVGISINAFDRYKQHANEKEWIDEVANMTIERFPCRGDALLAESSAIVKEKPKYNIAGNPLAPKKRISFNRKSRESKTVYKPALELNFQVPFKYLNTPLYDRISNAITKNSNVQSDKWSAFNSRSLSFFSINSDYITRNRKVNQYGREYDLFKVIDKIENAGIIVYFNGDITNPVFIDMDNSVFTMSELADENYFSLDRIEIPENEKVALSRILIMRSVIQFGEDPRYFSISKNYHKKVIARCCKCEGEKVFWFAAAMAGKGCEDCDGRF